MTSLRLGHNGEEGRYRCQSFGGNSDTWWALGLNLKPEISAGLGLGPFLQAKKVSLS